MTSVGSARHPVLVHLRRPSLARLTWTELRKSVDTRAGRWLVGLLALLAVAAAGYLLVGQTEDGPVMAARFFTVPWSVVRLLLPVVGVVSMTTEWSGRTALSTFTLVPRRGRVLTAKLGAALAVTLGTVLFTGAVAALAAAASGVLSGRPVLWAGLPAHLAGALVGGACFMGLGLALGALLQHTAGALVAYFLAPTLVTLAGTALVGDRVDWVAPTVAIIDLESLDLHGSAGSTITALTVWIALPLAVGTVRWLRREVP